VGFEPTCPRGAPAFSQRLKAGALPGYATSALIIFQSDLESTSANNNKVFNNFTFKFHGL